MDWTYHSLGDLVDYLDSIGHGPCVNRVRRKRRDNLRKLWRASGLSKTDWFNAYIAEKLQINYIESTLRMETNCFYITDCQRNAVPNISLADLPCAKECCTASVPKPKALSKGSKKMSDYHYDYDMGETYASSLAAKKLEYLNSRLQDTTYKIREDLEKAFGLVDDKAPATPSELVKRITDGKFILPKNEDQRDFYGLRAVIDSIRWRDPSVKEDNDGYKAANAKLEAEAIKARDLIMVSTPENAIAAVQALENWKPEGLAN